jgi:phospholipase/lecithinase/hemolysin
MRSRTTLALSLLLLVTGGSPGAAAAPRVDLSRLVVVGDSLSAGFQNGSLLASQQIHGYAALVAAQAGVELPLPLLAAPGIPSVLTLVDPGPPPVVVPAPGMSPGRIDPTVQAMNLAVPGATVADALTTRPDLPVDSLTDLVLGLPGLFGGAALSQVEWAEALAPTMLLVWIGNNDALGAALAGDVSALTPVADFEAAYAELLDRLAATGATLAVANIPDVTAIPFLTPAEEVAGLVGAPLSFIGPILGIGPGDFVTPDAFALIPAILGGFAAGPLPAGVVLDAAEVAQVQAATAAYNAVIATQARAKGAAVVDIHGFLSSAKARGIVVGGQRLTTDFLGGLFSLDGVHPTDTGSALIANEFIQALDARFAAGIPRIPIREIQRDDPLVLPGVGHPAGALGHPTPEAAATLRAVLGR